MIARKCAFAFCVDPDRTHARTHFCTIDAIYSQMKLREWNDGNARTRKLLWNELNAANDELVGKKEHREWDEDEVELKSSAPIWMALQLKLNLCTRASSTI